MGESIAEGIGGTVGLPIEITGNVTEKGSVLVEMSNSLHVNTICERTWDLWCYVDVNCRGVLVFDSTPVRSTGVKVGLLNTSRLGNDADNNNHRSVLGLSSMLRDGYKSPLGSEGYNQRYE